MIETIKHSDTHIQLYKRFKDQDDYRNWISIHYDKQDKEFSFFIYNKQKPICKGCDEYLDIPKSELDKARLDFETECLEFLSK